jgi:DNA processing protein
LRVAPTKKQLLYFATNLIYEIMPLSWIALNSVKGLGPVKIKQLVDHFGSADAVFRASAAELRRGGVVPEPCVAQILDKTLFEGAEKQLKMARDRGVAVLTPASEKYPPYLREIFAPPPVLFVKGDADVFSRHAVGVVGTRKPTAYGTTVTKTLVQEMVEHGLVIVSGLALGIDTVAHRACIEAGGATVAVLGCGIDRIYPASNAPLADDIARHGAVVSEFPMDSRPEAYHFPRRNRIISGLSAGIVLIEGGERSGGLITAHYALQQGRDVFAVPGPITSAMSMGPFNLIKQGAIPARSGQEIADALSLIANPLMKPGSTASLPPLAAPEQLLSAAERLVYDQLSGMPQRVDELAEACNKTIPELFDILLNLELKGLARQQSGQCYVRP